MSNDENTFKNLSEDVKNKAEEILSTLELKGFVVSYTAPTRSLTFKSGFKEMTVPLALLERQQWADIRQIYRAVFEPGPQVENFGAQNEWSRWTIK